MASIFHRWRRGQVPTNEDYLLLRFVAYDADPPHEEAYHFILDILSEPCSQWIVDVLAYYYGITQEAPDFLARTERLAHLMREAIKQAMLQCDQQVIAAYAQLAPGAEWTRLMKDQIRLVTWRVLEFKHPDLSPLSDEEFRIYFEKEWARLLHFQDGFYGFRVLPRLYLNEFVRYCLLPNCDFNIRSQISDYFAHQGTEYPHLAQLSEPDYVRSVYHVRLKRIFQPLVASIVHKALSNSQISRKDTQAQSDIEIQVWQQFEGALEKFRFYGPRKKVRLWGKMGLIGLPRSAELRRHFQRQVQERGLKHTDTFITLSDLTEVGFSHYIELKLKAWLNRTYPPEPKSREIVGDYFVDHQDHSPTPPPQLPDTFLGLDGIHYMQRRAAAQFYGVTEDQLRNWDRDASWPALRAGAVLALPLPPGISAKNRLYPHTEDARKQVEDLKLRKSTRSTRASEGECTRKIAAIYVGVAQSTLVDWEKKGCLQPARRGRSVIYSAHDVEAARRLKENSK